MSAVGHQEDLSDCDAYTPPLISIPSATEKWGCFAPHPRHHWISGAHIHTFLCCSSRQGVYLLLPFAGCSPDFEELRFSNVFENDCFTSSVAIGREVLEAAECSGLNISLPHRWSAP